LYLVNVPGSKDLDAAKIFQNVSDALYARKENKVRRKQEKGACAEYTRWQCMICGERNQQKGARHCKGGGNMSWTGEEAWDTIVVRVVGGRKEETGKRDKTFQAKQKPR
jgi:hypothetical protein